MAGASHPPQAHHHGVGKVRHGPGRQVRQGGHRNDEGAIPVGIEGQPAGSSQLAVCEGWHGASRSVGEARRGGETLAAAAEGVGCDHGLLCSCVDVKEMSRPPKVAPQDLACHTTPMQIIRRARTRAGPRSWACAAWMLPATVSTSAPVRHLSTVHAPSLPANDHLQPLQVDDYRLLADKNGGWVCSTGTRGQAHDRAAQVGGCALVAVRAGLCCHPGGP